MEEELFCFPSKTASHRLVLLHGWGADAEDLLPLGQSLVESLQTSIELIALRAPDPHPEGVGRQWYGLFPPDWNEAGKAISELYIRLKKLDSTQISLRKTILMGFSQGGAMAIATGAKLPLAGLIACSAYPHPDFMPPSNLPPVLITHGIQDPVVPINASKNLFELLERKNSKIELEIFDGVHEIPQEINLRIQLFIEKCFENSIEKEILA
ncbi:MULTISPECIES: alpha/beta hydrolase [unclassified Prochlorococcus]|uniref:alpha/beta hydrolase n=1 Tax=unclassified Prochlorococcus TaxID=2627481 RepID=UPI00053399FB|nr:MULTISPECIES: alpha/beta fold hydrolase [unclassified Prochlorococcus]KGG16661.1 Phospholipase/carboxylesterase family protein [Prochlorococcus sp. MIT 0602]KGG18367.1 Phospholipase/carboxylesterase family protein [Prochlorococcus sp. MIT 0603]